MRLIGRFRSELEESLFDLSPIDTFPIVTQVGFFAPHAVVRQVRSFSNGKRHEWVEMVEAFCGVGVLACDGSIGR
jgi:hypothetical protein